jgi:hypothetical protein
MSWRMKSLALLAGILEIDEYPATRDTLNQVGDCLLLNKTPIIL